MDCGAYRKPSPYRNDGGLNMNPIINSAQAQKHTLTMSSREIAILTGKAHGHVIRDCKRMFEELDFDQKGYIRNWIHPQNNRQYFEFLLSRNLVETLITGYSTKLRFVVINRLHELEDANKKLQEQLNFSLKKFEILNANLSDAGRFLCIGGKKTKPSMYLEIKTLISTIQLSLFDFYDSEGTK